MHKKATAMKYKHVINLVFLVIGFFLIWNSFFGANTGSSGNMISNSPSGALTKPLSVIWTLLASVIFVKDLLFSILGQTSGNREDVLPLRLLSVMALIGLIVFLIPNIGFLLSITIFLPLLLVLIGARGKWQVTIATVILGPAIWFVFHHVLLLRLPTIFPGGIL